MDQQQLGAFWLTVVTGLVQGRVATRCQVYTRPTLQQESQALIETSTGCDVKWRCQLLLISQ